MRKLVANSLLLGTLLIGVSLTTIGADQKDADAKKPIQPEKAELGRPIDFDRDIYPILEANCVACHNKAIKESEFILEDVKGILKGGASGPAVVPGKPEESPLYLAASRAEEPLMPPLPNKVEARALTPKELGLMQQWILEGAKGGSGSANDMVQWQPLPPGFNAIYSVALAPWGTVAAAGRANQISVYDMTTYEEIARLRDPALASIALDGKPMYPTGAAHRDFVHSLAFNTDGTMLASGGYRVVKLWKRPQNVQLAQLTAANTVTTVAVNANATWAAVGSADNSIVLLNLKDGKPGPSLSGHTAPVTSLQFWPTAEDQVQIDNALSAAHKAVTDAVKKERDAKRAVETFDPAKKKLDAEQAKAEQDKLAAALDAATKAIEPAKAAVTAATEAKLAFDKKVAEQTKLVSASQDKTIRVWNVGTAAIESQIETPAPVNAVVFDKEATRVISAHPDNLIRVWTLAAKPAEGENKEPPKPTLEIKGHGGPVTSLALIRPAGTQIASGSDDATLRIWDLSNGNAVRSLAHGGPVKSVAARPDGAAVASAGANMAKLWDMAGKQLAEMKGDLDAERKVIDVKDEQAVAKQLVALADNTFKESEKNQKDRQEAAKKAKEAKDAADKKVADVQKVFDEAAKKSADATKVATDAADAMKLVATALEEAVKKVQADAESLKQAVAKKDEAAKKSAEVAVLQKQADDEKAKADKQATDTETAAKAAAEKAAEAKKASDGDVNNNDLKQALANAEKASADAATAAKTAADAKAVAEKNQADAQAASKAAVEALTAAEKARVDAETAAKASEEARKTAEAAVKPADEKNKAALAAKDTVDKETEKQKNELKKETDTQQSAVRSVQLADEAVKTADVGLTESKTKKEQTEAAEKTVTANVATAEASKVESEKPALRVVAFSPDSLKVVTGGDDQRLRVWNAQSGLALETLSGHSAPVTCVAFGTDNRIVSGSEDKKAVVWDVQPDWQLAGQLGPAQDKPLELGSSPIVGRVLALDFSADGKWLASGGGDPSRSGELLIWDVEKQSLARELPDAHSDTVFSLQFSRDGKHLVSGAADKFVKVFDPQTGKHVRSFEGHTHHVLGVSWKADGSAIASAGADNAIKIWNVETGEQSRTINSYQKQVTCIQFMGVSEDVVSCGGDASVRFHKASNGQNFRNFSGGTDFMYAAAAARDSKMVVAGGEDGVLRVWNGDNASVLKNFDPPDSTPPPGVDLQASK